MIALATLSKRFMRRFGNSQSFYPSQCTPIHLITILGDYHCTALAGKLSSFTKGGGEGEVLLVFPGKYNAPNPQVPLSLLHLAAYLRRNDFRVNIYDMRTEKYSDSIVRNPLFVGLSSMSGHQIRYGLNFAQKIRDVNVKTPIVWGVSTRL